MQREPPGQPGRGIRPSSHLSVVNCCYTARISYYRYIVLYHHHHHEVWWEDPRQLVTYGYLGQSGLSFSFPVVEWKEWVEGGMGKWGGIEPLEPTK